MKLKTVYVRFYKSFNFDYLRKSHDEAKPFPWEIIDRSLWYPHVRIPVDSRITTIVGANESGKSHLLTAIEKGITGKNIEREDFCRYSEFYSVERGKLKWPDFGFEWTDMTEQEQQVIHDACGVPPTSFNRFLLFRSNRDDLTAYVPSGDTFVSHGVKPEKAQQLIDILPQLLRIAANIALPENVPTRYLASSAPDAASSRLGSMGRKQRFNFLETLNGVLGHTEWFSSSQAVTQQAQPIASAMSALLSSPGGGQGTVHNLEVELARKLLYQVANIDPAAIDDLYRALKEGKDGHANGLIQEVNNHLAASLNFPKWWVQDKDVRLTVSCRDHDVVFTIRDRTGTEYSFSERSDGLKYFLSYYVQYRAHESLPNRSEILLMDEPDTYLSAQAQQDLLRIFDAFANPEDAQRPIQVIYVTHSPFLIDKNHAERIRVLEKGLGDEGTRVVNDASRNHYEPLRSAFGAFVGETTFIGNCNLMVEGAADQILLAGAAANLSAAGAGALETLDLNRVTIVPAGSASQIPYLVYLARGRDIEQPAVIVLMDSDSAGTQARKQLKRGGAYGKQLLRDELILQVGDLASETGFSAPPKLVEMEDLVPLPIAVAAARRYAIDVCGLAETRAQSISTTLVSEKLANCATLFDAIETTFNELYSDSMRLTKIGLARNIVELATEVNNGDEQEHGDLKDGIREFQGNMKILFRKLNTMRRIAEREQSDERVSQRIGRTKKSFLQDHTVTATREQAHVLFEDIAATLDPGSLESDSVTLAIQRVRREFEIDIDMTKPIPNFEGFKQALDSIRYAARLAFQDRKPSDPSESTMEGYSSDDAAASQTAESKEGLPAL